jgi:hypothetical protein
VRARAQEVEMEEGTARRCWKRGRWMMGIARARVHGSVSWESRQCRRGDGMDGGKVGKKAWKVKTEDVNVVST